MNKPSKDIVDRCDAICPHCGGILCPRRDQLGETIICKDTGKEFVLTEFRATPRPAPSVHPKGVAVVRKQENMEVCHGTMWMR